MPKPKNMILLCGLPRSGKSSFCNHLLTNNSRSAYQVICADDIRLAMGHKFHEYLEPMVHSMNIVFCRAHLIRGLNLIIDETNTNPNTIGRWLDLVDDFEYEKILYIVNTPKSVCLSRVVDDDGLNKTIERMSYNLDKMLKNSLSIFKQFDYVLIGQKDNWESFDQSNEQHINWVLN